jgi:cell division protein FtsB
LRWLALAFVVLIAALQYPMWLGKGGWLQVRELDRQLAAQRDGNARLKARNDALDADVRDLKTGFDAIEERARSELGMVKQDEVFFQIQQRSEQAIDAPPPQASGPSGETATLPIRPAAPGADRR